MVERLSEAAAEGRGIAALESALESMARLISGPADDLPRPSATGAADDPGVDRLFRTLVPDVTGRRSGREILDRLGRKWDLAHSLHDVLHRLRDRVRELADLKGPALDVLARLEASFAQVAPESVASLRALVGALDAYGLDLDSVDLDLGFGRGIGFYSRMVFEIVVPTADGPFEVCGGGRYDGLARVLGGSGDDRGAGFAFGLERLASVAPSSDFPARSRSGIGISVFAAPGAKLPAIRLASGLRKTHQSVVLDLDDPPPAEANRRALGAAIRGSIASSARSTGPGRSRNGPSATTRRGRFGPPTPPGLLTCSPAARPPEMPADPIRLAIPSKGHLYEGVVDLLKTAGYKVRRASDRQYEAVIAGHPRFHVVFMRPADIVTQVQEGRCHLGVTGFDVFAERSAEAEDVLVVIQDLGYGGCRLVVAVPESWIDVVHAIDLADLTAEFKAAGRTFRVSTKYPSLVRSYFRKYGIYHYQMIESDGALELHPSLGIADIIVDLASSGTTLKDNRLREVEGGTVLESAACLIGHGPTLKSLAAEGPGSPLALLLDAIDGVRASEGWLHLEVVGAPGTDPDASSAVAALLADRGARHVARGEVWAEGGAPSWRVTALVAAKALPALRRPLRDRGAARVVGLPARFVYDRDEVSTFDAIAGHGR